MSVEVTTTGGTIVSASTGSGTSVSLTSSSTSVSVTSPAANSVSITSKGPKGDTGATGPIGPEIAGGPYLPLSAGSGFPLTGELDMSSNKITDVLAGTNNLDAVNYQQLTAAVLGVLVYKGIWNATTNDPALESGAGTVGSYYIVSTAGTTALDGISDWVVGDWAVFSDLPTDAWQKIDNTSILGGGGTGGKLPVWTGSGTSKTLGDSVITEASSKIGIGTTAPSKRLDIRTNGVGDGITLATSTPKTFALISNGNSESFPVGKFNLWYGTTNVVGITALSNTMELSGGYATGGIIKFRSHNTEVMRMTNVGLGIGTTSPGFNLDIYEDSSETLPMIKLRQDGVGDATIGFNIIGSTQASVGLDNSDEDKFKISRSEALGSSTQLTIDSSGNVGIGTASPASKLHLQDTSDVYVTLESSNASTAEEVAIKYSNYSTGSNFWWEGLNQSEAWSLAYGTSFSGANTRLTVQSTGNVGIGTTSPAKKLDVSGIIRGMGTGATNLGSTVTGAAFQTEYTHNPSVGLLSIGSLQSGGGGLAHYIQAVNTAGTTAKNIVLNPYGGNVGIGTTAPAYKLDVNGTGFFDGRVTIKSQGVGDSISILESSTSNKAVYMGESAVGHGFLTLFEKSVGEVIKFDANGNSFINRGNVGIGTTSPAGLLHVSSGTSGDAIVIIESDTDNNDENDNPQLQFKQDGGSTIAKAGLTGNAGTIFTNSLANAAYFGNDEAASLQLYANATARLTIREDGNVGIGTTSPASKLHVAGTVQVGVDDTGHDVQFFGATSGSYMLWDESADVLNFVNSKINITGSGGSQLSVTAGNAAWDASINLDTSGANGQWQIKAEGSDETFRIVNIDQGGTAPLTIHPTTKATTFAGDVYVLDSLKLRAGNAGDLSMLHNGTNSFLQNETGNLTIVNYTDDKDILFQSDDGAGGVAEYFRLDGSAATHDGSATTALTTNWPDKSKITLGTGSDLQIYHDGSNSYIIDAGTGDLLNYFSNDWKVIKYGSSEICIAATSDGSVDLYYDSALKLKTVTAGVEITGELSATAGVRMGNDTATASADNVGTQRYRATANNSYVEMSMQTAASGYSWVIIKENSW